MPKKAATNPTPEKSKPGWTIPFLERLSHGATVSDSCKAAGVHRSTAYRYRDADPEFESAWHEVEERSTEQLEAEAFRRAVKGVQKPIYHQGKRVGSVREYSDQLLVFLLKARRPETYRERISIDDERERRQRQELEREDEAGLDRRLTDFDNVTPIRKAS